MFLLLYKGQINVFEGEIVYFVHGAFNV